MINFNHETHTYTESRTGKVWPSVTQILKQLGNLFDSIPPDVLERKRLLGTAVHEACELHDKDAMEGFELHQDVLPYLDQYLCFLSDTGASCVANEQLVFSERFKFAGTLDRIYSIAGKRVLCDIKTSATVLMSYGPQTAGYAMCDGVDIDSRAILLLAPDHYKFIPMNGMQDKNVFLSCLTLHNYKASQK